MIIEDSDLQEGVLFAREQGLRPRIFTVFQMLAMAEIASGCAHDAVVDDEACGPPLSFHPATQGTRQPSQAFRVGGGGPNA
jgi:hypothetical protein